MSDQDSIIQRKFLTVSLLLIGFPPRAQQFASRKPTCAGPTQILLFYYFTILLFYYFTNFMGNREFASRKPNLACRTRNCGVRHARLGFRDAKRAPEMHGTKPQVCISKTYLCMSDPKKVCISKTQPCMSDPQFACRTEGSRPEALHPVGGTGGYMAFRVFHAATGLRG